MNNIDNANELYNIIYLNPNSGEREISKYSLNFLGFRLSLALNVCRGYLAKVLF